MLLLRLWNYIRGYVIILIEGYFLEKFINICTHRQIFLWDIKKQKNTKMTLKVSINGFRCLRPVAKKARCRVRIYRKRGLPFLLNRYRNRKTFALGAVIFVLLFIVLTSFIWEVEITGNEKVDSQQIISSLAMFGVKPGVLKYNINTDNIVNRLMLDINDLSWAGVTLKGTRIKVQVAERVKPPELVPQSIPCDIVARRDGVIKSIVTKSGLEKVKSGNTVTKGQVLISGIIPNKNDEKNQKLVHAIGTVKARTWYESSFGVNTFTFEKERTGDHKDQYSLVFLTKKLDLFHSSVPYPNYEKIEIRKRMSFGNDLILPFELIVYRYYENNIIENEKSIDEAKKQAADNAFREAANGMPEGAEIVKTNLNFLQKNDGSIYANVIIECIEDIGITKEIGGQ